MDLQHLTRHFSRRVVGYPGTFFKRFKKHNRLPGYPLDPKNPWKNEGYLRVRTSKNHLTNPLDPKCKTPNTWVK